jgi:hypothetical protein
MLCQNLHAGFGVRWLALMRVMPGGGDLEEDRTAGLPGPSMRIEGLIVSRATVGPSKSPDVDDDDE